MNNPILQVLNGGRGVTPVPADALLQPGDELQIASTQGAMRKGVILAVVPAKTPVEYAIADQNGEPRPLMIRENRKRQTLYVIRIVDADGVEIDRAEVTQEVMARGLSQAKAAPDADAGA